MSTSTQPTMYQAALFWCVPELIKPPYMPLLQASNIPICDYSKWDLGGYDLLKWWAMWWYLPPFLTPNVEDLSLKTTRWSLVGLFHIFLCNFAYSEAHNEKLEYFKLSEGACPSHEEERSLIYKTSPHSFKSKILSKGIFLLAFGGILVLANLSCGSGVVFCLWHLLMISVPFRYMFLLK